MWLKATEPTTQCTDACRWYLDHLPSPDSITKKSGNEVSVTCMARRRLLTNTLLNLMSLRYLPTASPCPIPVSDRSVSTPCPEIEILSMVNGPASRANRWRRGPRRRTLQQLVFVVRRLTTTRKKQKQNNSLELTQHACLRQKPYFNFNILKPW